MIPAAEKMIICGSIGSPAARAQAPGKSDRVAGGKGLETGNIWKIENILKRETFGKLKIFGKGKHLENCKYLEREIFGKLEIFGKGKHLEI